MVEFGYCIDDTNLYIDDSMEDNKFLRGRKQGSTSTFMVSNRKTANQLYYNNRIAKIKKIKENINGYKIRFK